MAAGGGMTLRAGHCSPVHDAVILPREGVMAAGARQESSQMCAWLGVAGFAGCLCMRDLRFQPAGQGVADSALANVGMPGR